MTEVAAARTLTASILERPGTHDRILAAPLIAAGCFAGSAIVAMLHRR
ncbi:hypothetical protein [Candidatus Poriferisodalis sp.]